MLNNECYKIPFSSNGQTLKATLSNSAFYLIFEILMPRLSTFSP